MAANLLIGVKNFDFRIDHYPVVRRQPHRKIRNGFGALAGFAAFYLDTPTQGRVITLRNIDGALSPKSRHCNHSIAASGAESAARHTHGYNREEGAVVEKGTNTCTQGPYKYTSRPMLPCCSTPFPADRSSIGSDSRKLRLRR